MFHSSLTSIRACAAALTRGAPDSRAMRPRRRTLFTLMNFKKDDRAIIMCIFQPINWSHKNIWQIKRRLIEMKYSENSDMDLHHMDPGSSYFWTD